MKKKLQKFYHLHYCFSIKIELIRVKPQIPCWFYQQNWYRERWRSASGLEYNSRKKTCRISHFCIIMLALSKRETISCGIYDYYIIYLKEEDVLCFLFLLSLAKQSPTRYRSSKSLKEFTASQTHHNCEFYFPHIRKQKDCINGWGKWKMWRTNLKKKCEFRSLHSA